jgi:hypothetical protein
MSMITPEYVRAVQHDLERTAAKARRHGPAARRRRRLFTRGR